MFCVFKRGSLELIFFRRNGQSLRWLKRGGGHVRWVRAFERRGAGHGHVRVYCNGPHWRDSACIGPPVVLCLAQKQVCAPVLLCRQIWRLKIGKRKKWQNSAEYGLLNLSFCLFWNPFILGSNMFLQFDKKNWWLLIFAIKINWLDQLISH